MFGNIIIEFFGRKKYYISGDGMNSIVNNGFFCPQQKKTYIMGILNVTPDSFSDGGKYNSLNEALKHTEKMLSEGADIIDIGAVSTRPFSDKVGEEEEWERLEATLTGIKKRFDCTVSVDTVSPLVARRSILAGADIINDVSGVFSSEMADVIKSSECGWIVMHGGIGVRRAEEIVEFSDGIVNDVNKFFAEMIENAQAYGIEKGRLCLDPGFGFSKTNEQNMELFMNSEKLEAQGLPILCALSRKRFISDISGEEDKERLIGTLAANLVAVKKGASIVRVHDVAAHKKAFDYFDAHR